MLPLRSRLIVAVASLVSLSCASTGNTDYTWSQSRFGQLPTGLSGSPVMLFPIMGVAVAPDFNGTSDTTSRARAEADSVLFATLSRRLTTIFWVSAQSLRDRSREHGLVQPDSLPMHTMSLQVMHRVSEPLLGQLRKLNDAVHGRFLMVPVRVTYRPGKKQYPARAELSVLLLELASGVIAWRSDVAGEAETAPAALAQAILGVTGTWR